jgi:hypothetical protein
MKSILVLAVLSIQFAGAQPTKAYLMAYHTCSSSSSCSNPANHTVQLAESANGSTWTSVPGYSTISNSGSVPDVITRGDKLYLYSTAGVRRYTRSTNAWETTVTTISVKDAVGATVNYVDPSLIVDASGNLVLFFLESAGAGTGDPATCTTYPCTKNFKSATEVSGSNGTQFVVNTGVRLAINLTANSASDPDIYYDGTKYILYISSGTNTLAYTSTTMHGTYTAIPTLTNAILTGDGGIGSGYFDPITNNYWTYVHTNAGEIKQKVHASLSTAITGFTTVINFATAGLASGALAQSPGICKNDLTIPTAVSNLSAGQFIQLYPNPVRGDLIVKFNLGIQTSVTMKIFDKNGAELLNKKAVTTGTSINIGQFSSGVYLVLFYDKNGRNIYSDKIMKE